VLGWLVFGWASRNAERRRKSVKASYAMTMVLWWLPPVLIAPNVVIARWFSPHETLPPIWDWLGQPTFSLLFLAGCVSAFTALVKAGLPRHLPDAATEVSVRAE
jgi:hypothetical protein